MKPTEQRPWRVGRKVGRTIYAQQGTRPSDNDPLIGVMDTPELARAAVDARNGVTPPCPFCGKPETADHWRRISAGWERVAWSVAVTALIVGCGVGFVIGSAVFP